MELCKGLTYYSVGTSFYEHLLSRSTQPSGGYTEYTYEKTCRAASTCGESISNGSFSVFVAEDVVVKTKTENDINGTTLNWEYVYSQIGDFDFTSASYAHNQSNPVGFPEGKLVYKHHSGKWTTGVGISNYALAGMLASKSTYKAAHGVSDELLETEKYDYSQVKISSQNSSRFPMSALGYSQNDSYLIRTTKKLLPVTAKIMLSNP